MTVEPKWGPAMKALPNDRWRAACIAWVHGCAGSSANNYGYTTAYRVAGYTTTSENAARVEAHRMFHDPRMQAAIQEEARKSMVAMVPLARATIEAVVQMPGNKDQLAAAKTILDRAGVHEVREEVITHEHTMSPEFQQRAILMAQRMGLPIDKLVGNRLAALLPAPVTDAEYEEVPKARTLEDIL